MCREGKERKGREGRGWSQCQGGTFLQLGLRQGKNQQTHGHRLRINPCECRSAAVSRDGPSASCPCSQPQRDAPHPTASLAGPGHPAAAPQQLPGKDLHSPPPAPQQTSLSVLLSTHLSHPCTPTPPWSGGYGTATAARAWGMVMGLFPCSSDMMLNALRARSFSTASKCHSRTGRWGLRLKQTQRQGQTPVRMGRGSVQGRTSKPAPKMLPAQKGPPRLW